MKNRFGLLLLLFLSLFACKNQDNGLKSEDFVVNIRIKADPGRLNPMYGVSNPVSREIYPYIFLQLAEFDPASLALSPILAKEIGSIVKITDGPYLGKGKISFEILEDAVWADGQPITGFDYQFTVKLIRNPLIQAQLYRAAIVEIVDVKVDESYPKKFDIYVDTPQMLTLETIASLEILPAHIYDAAGMMSEITIASLSDENIIDKLNANESVKAFSAMFNTPEFHLEKMSGAGPYILAEWETDQYVQLIRKENWWGDQYPERTFLNANPKELIFHIIPDENTALSLLKSGEIDIMTFADGINFKNFQDQHDVHDKFEFFTPEKLNYYFLALNNRKKTLADKNVRRALSALLDVDDIINTLEKGLGTRQTSLLSPFDDDYNTSIKPIDLDLDHSRRLLSDAGWEDSNNNNIRDKVIDGKLTELELEILITSQELGQRIALLLKENARKVGIQITTKLQSFSITRKENIPTGDFDIIPYRASTYLGDYDPSTMWHSKNANPIRSNISGYQNESADLLIEKIKNATEPKDRNEPYQQLQNLVFDDQPVVFLYAPREKIAVNKRLKALTSVKRPCYFPNAFELN